MELLAGNALFVDGGSENDKKGSRRRVGTEYIKSDKVLAPYFRMAIAVLTLIARVRETPDLAQWIRLKYAEHTIAWPDYYYGLGEHGRLYEFLHRNGQLIGSRKRNRPASVVVAIDRTREVHLTRHRSWAVPCRTSKCATQEFGDISLHPWLYVNDEGLARKIHTWTLVLVCAIPTTAILSPAPAPRLRPFAKINLPIVNRA